MLSDSWNIIPFLTIYIRPCLFLFFLFLFPCVLLESVLSERWNIIPFLTIYIRIAFLRAFPSFASLSFLFCFLASCLSPFLHSRHSPIHTLSILSIPFISALNSVHPSFRTFYLTTFPPSLRPYLFRTPSTYPHAICTCSHNRIYFVPRALLPFSCLRLFQPFPILQSCTHMAVLSILIHL